MKKLFTLLAAATAVFGMTATTVKAPQRLAGAGAAHEKIARTSENNPRFKAPAEDLSALPLVTELPEGTVEKEYSRDSRFFALDYMGQFTFQYDYGLISEVAYGEDGKVYFKNPYGGLDTNTWLVGTREGDTVNVEFPQKIYEEVYPWWDDEGNEITMTDTYYAFRLLYSTSDESSRMDIDYTNQTVKFEITDGGLRMAEDNNVYIGMLISREETDESGQPVTTLGWTGYADTALDFSTVTAVENTLPEGIKLSKWVLTDSAGSRLVDAGFDGDTYYVQGLFTDGPEMVLKGTLKDGKVSFPTAQYLGECTRYDHYGFFVATTSEIIDPEDPNGVSYTIIPEMAFSYDAEKQTLTPDAEDYDIVLSTLQDRIFLINSYRGVSLAWQDDTTPMTPENPTILDYNMDTFDDYGYGYCSYEIPVNSADGRLLDLDNLYYNLLADGEAITYYPDEDPDLLEPMTDIPYYYEDSCIYFWGDMHEAMLFTSGYEHFGIRLFYINTDGTKTYSDPVYWDGWTGIESTGIDNATVVAEEYFNTAGQRIACPADGIAIRRAHLSDGSVRVSKIVVK